VLCRQRTYHARIQRSFAILVIHVRAHRLYAALLANTIRRGLVYDSASGPLDFSGPAAWSYLGQAHLTSPVRQGVGADRRVYAHLLVLGCLFFRLDLESLIIRVQTFTLHVQKIKFIFLFYRMCRASVETELGPRPQSYFRTWLQAREQEALISCSSSNNARKSNCDSRSGAFA
jgi:hypothetical protein